MNTKLGFYQTSTSWRIGFLPFAVFFFLFALPKARAQKPELVVQTGHSSRVTSVSFSREGKYIVTGSWDATTKIWEVSSGRELASLISIGEKDWAVTTPDGLFDASEGAEQYLHFVKGLEIIELNQLKERYYDPKLLAKLLGFYKDEALLSVTPFTAQELYPEIALPDTLETSAPNLKIHLTNRGGGIGRVIVSINGKEISSDARRANADPNARELQLAIPIADHPYLIPGKENVIEVKAFNAAGYLASRNLRAVYKAPAKEQIVPPHLWAIVAGVSDYRGQNIDLRYAAKDANHDSFIPWRANDEGICDDGGFGSIGSTRS